MSLLTKVDVDLRESLKARDAVRAGALRMLKTNIKNTAIARRVAEDALEDNEIIAVIRQEVKKRKEAIDAYAQAGRTELANKERGELTVLESYLPQSMSADDLSRLISEAVAEQKLTPPYQFGALMGAVHKKVAGRAEGAAVKQAVEAFIKAQ